MKRVFSNRKYKSGTRWCVWQWSDIDPLKIGVTFLLRLHLFQTPWCSLMLHWFNYPDPQPDMHDHPVNLLSFVVRGGYEEEREIDGKTVKRQVKWWNFIRATDRHRIVKLNGPTITLVLAGKVVRKWGFWTKDGWVSWRDYKEISQ